MHQLASNLVKQLKDDFCNYHFCEGKTFDYISVSYGELESGEVVTIEKLIEDSFFKYINNDGTINLDYCHNARQTAETLCYYSFFF